MFLTELIKKKELEIGQNNFIQFSDQEIKNLNTKQAQKIMMHFQGNTLLKLPPDEIKFFEWLKKNDSKVWNDIWGVGENIYLVSVDFLTQFLEGRNGFPICDLQTTSNYYFTVKHIKPGGLQQMQAILDKLENKDQLEIDELLLYDLHLAPTDIWHFSYTYDLPLSNVKQMISEMEYKGWIVHLRESQDLLRYIEI
jgi:hypothetical protein